MCSALSRQFGLEWPSGRGRTWSWQSKSGKGNSKNRRTEEPKNRKQKKQIPLWFLDLRFLVLFVRNGVRNYGKRTAQIGWRRGCRLESRDNSAAATKSRLGQYDGSGHCVDHWICHCVASMGIAGAGGRRLSRQ